MEVGYLKNLPIGMLTWNPTGLMRELSAEITARHFYGVLVLFLVLDEDIEQPQIFPVIVDSYISKEGENWWEKSLGLIPLILTGAIKTNFLSFQFHNVKFYFILEGNMSNHEKYEFLQNIKDKWQRKLEEAWAQAQKK